VDRPVRFIPTFVRFQRFDYLNDIWAGAVYLSLLDSRIKVIPFGREGKMDAFDLTPVEPNKVACQQIQSRAEIVDRVTDDQRDLIRKFFGDSDDPTRLLGLSVVLKNDAIRISFEKCVNFSVEVRDVALGPFNL